MSSDNTITIAGNITRDPELKYLPSGVSLASFGVAVNRRWLNKSTNEWEEQTSFFDVTCWREMAENVVASLPKGSRVVVTGRLEQRSWETEDGDKRSKVEIIADEIGPSLRWATAVVERTERIAPGPQRASNGVPESQTNQQRSAVMAGAVSSAGASAASTDPF
jgi:single-strand DNA-binding protein